MFDKTEQLVCGSAPGSAPVSGFAEGAQLFGVDVLQLLQLPLSSSVQILDVHHVRLLDPGVLPELVLDSGEEARFVPTSSQELPVQSQDLLLQLTVPRHGGEWQVVNRCCHRYWSLCSRRHKKMGGTKQKHVSPG